MKTDCRYYLPKNEVIAPKMRCCVSYCVLLHLAKQSLNRHYEHTPLLSLHQMAGESNRAILRNGHTSPSNHHRLAKCEISKIPDMTDYKSETPHICLPTHLPDRSKTFRNCFL